MRFHHADTAGPRFLQSTYQLIFRARLDSSHLEHAFHELLRTWPILRGRLNFMRTGSFSTDDTAGFWQLKKIESPLAEYFPLNHLAWEEIGEPEQKLVDELFDLPSFKSYLLPPILRVQVLQFQDGCLMQFILQHAFCDGTGFHRIVSAYASLVRGETIQPIDEKRPSQLVFQTSIEGCETPNQLSEQVYQLTFRHWATGWMGLIFTGLAQWLIKAWSPSERLLRNMHIPPSVIDRLNNLAKQRDLFLTRNDLLMAIIAQAAMASFPDISRIPIGFMLNFNKGLARPASLHNGFWPVSIPMPLSREMDMHGHQDDQLIKLAIHIRQAVNAARCPRTLELFRKWYETMGSWQPLYPANFYPNSPNIQVSSLSQEWYDISFGTESKPCHVQMYPSMIDIFNAVGFCYHDLIIAIKDRDGGGYCIRGSLHKEVWKQLEYLRDE